MGMSEYSTVFLVLIHKRTRSVVLYGDRDTIPFDSRSRTCEPLRLVNSAIFVDLEDVFSQAQ